MSAEPATVTPAPRPFSEVTPNFQLVWDSTSLGWFKTCPRYYYYQMILGYAPKSKSIHLTFGGWYASGVELYAKARAEGQDHNDAVLAMVKWAMGVTGTRDEAGVFTPWESGDQFKNRYTLIRSLVWNVDDREHSPWRTVILANGKPAVELSFKFEAFTVGDETIYLSGHMDEVVENDGRTWVKDDKTTKGAVDANYFRHWTPNNQMSLYSIAGKVILNRPVSGVLVRATQIQVGFNRFNTQQVPRPEPILTEWLADAKYWIERARECAINNHWPMNDTACTNYMGCAFQRVCSVSPSHRKAWLAEDFVKFTWNPLVER